MKETWLKIGILILGVVIIVELFLVNESIRVTNVHLNAIDLDVVHAQDAIYPLYNK